MIQKGREEDKPVSVLMMTHSAKEAGLHKALTKIENLGLSDKPAMADKDRGGRRLKMQTNHRKRRKPFAISPETFKSLW